MSQGSRVVNQSMMMNHSSNPNRPWGSLQWALPLIVLALLAGVAAAQPHGERPAAETAIDVIVASQEIEKVLLKEDRERYEELAVRRVATAARLQEVRRAIDGWIPAENPAAADRLGQLIQQLEKLEGERSELLVTERLLLHQIRDRLRSIELFDEELELLRAANATRPEC